MSVQEPWGSANPLRGREYTHIAVRFIDENPKGKRMTPDDFDAWATRNGYLIHPGDVRRQSDAWKAHLQRRHELKQKINKAGTHPRMEKIGSVCFTITVLGANLWEVRAPEEEVSRHKLAQKVITAADTQRRQLIWLMQSANWGMLPPHERTAAEMLFDDIENFRAAIDQQATFVIRKFTKLRQKLADAHQLELPPMDAPEEEGSGIEHMEPGA